MLTPRHPDTPTHTLADRCADLAMEGRRSAGQREKPQQDRVVWHMGGTVGVAQVPTQQHTWCGTWGCTADGKVTATVCIHDERVEGRADPLLRHILEVIERLRHRHSRQSHTGTSTAVRARGVCGSAGASGGEPERTAGAARRALGPMWIRVPRPCSEPASQSRVSPP